MDDTHQLQCDAAFMRVSVDMCTIVDCNQIRLAVQVCWHRCVLVLLSQALVGAKHRAARRRTWEFGAQAHNFALKRQATHLRGTDAAALSRRGEVERVVALQQRVGDAADIALAKRESRLHARKQCGVKRFTTLLPYPHQLGGAVCTTVTKDFLVGGKRMRARCVATHALLGGRVQVVTSPHERPRPDAHLDEQIDLRRDNVKLRRRNERGRALQDGRHSS
eukprot:1330839-Pleurochrysis_carterae.AAC.4